MLDEQAEKGDRSMMQDDTMVIQDKATTLYHRLDDLTVNGDLTIEQFVILDEALTLWVEYRQGIIEAQIEEENQRRRYEIDAESYVTDPDEWNEILRQAAADEESLSEAYAWLNEQEMENIRQDTMSEERI
jgi:hypothetical protein